MAIEAAKLTATPVVLEQDKAAPELVARTSKIDAKQKASSCVIDFIGGIATLNVVEGEYDGANFHRVQGKQIAVDLADLWTALANKSKSALPTAFAQFVLDTATAPVPEE